MRDQINWSSGAGAGAPLPHLPSPLRRPLSSDPTTDTCSFSPAAEARAHPGAWLSRSALLGVSRHQLEGHDSRLRAHVRLLSFGKEMGTEISLPALEKISHPIMVGRKVNWTRS